MQCLWLPLGPFGSFWVPLGSLWLPLRALRLPLAPLGCHWADFGLALAFGCPWVPLGALGLEEVRYYSLEAFLVEMDGYYQLLPAITSYYQLLLAITGNYRELPGITGYYRRLPVITARYYQLLPAMLLLAITGYYSLGHVKQIWDLFFSEIKSACGMTTAGTKPFGKHNP